MITEFFKTETLIGTKVSRENYSLTNWSFSFERVDQPFLQQSFDALSIKPNPMSDKMYGIPQPPAMLNFAANAMTAGGTDNSLFTSWPVVGVETTVNENQFSFGMPTPSTMMNMPMNSNDQSTQSFGYNYGMTPFYPNFSAYCGCADCLNKPNLYVGVNAYHGIYSSDESSSTVQKPPVGSNQQSKEHNRSVAPFHYSSGDSSELDSDAHFELQRFYASGANPAENVQNSEGSEEFISTPSSESRSESNTKQIEQDSSKLQQKSTYQSDNRTPFTALTNENIDYYASMNSFPNQQTSNTTSLFPNYNRAAIGAGDGIMMPYRPPPPQADQSNQVSLPTMCVPPQQPPVMMYNNTSPYALPYMSWSQGEPLMMPTLFTPNAVSDGDTSYQSSMRPPMRSAIGNQNVFTGDERPLGHDEHNPDYTNCFPSSNPNVSNGGQESY